MLDVRQRGDAALEDWTARIDGVKLNRLVVPDQDLKEAIDNISREQRQALEAAADRIRQFYQAQPVTSWITQATGGILGQLVRPIKRVGLYIPSGTAPLPSTVLMSVIPAQVAGVSEIAIATPPNRTTGRIAPIILAAAALLEIHEVITLGGAQAIAALAFGTQTITRVDKIFGPGNLFVTLAKRQVFGMVGIDGLAGPTETLIIADESAKPSWIAADLLAQAEHDAMAAAILMSPSKTLISQVQVEISYQIEQLGRAEIIDASLANRSGAVLTKDLDEAIELANTYAPEHLCLSVADPWQWVDKIYGAGGIFMGENSCEVLGDYVAGPSHVMPTGGSARFSSPLNILDFVHLVSLVSLDRLTTQQIAPIAQVLALAEGLDAHAHAAKVRFSGESR